MACSNFQSWVTFLAVSILVSPCAVRGAIVPLLDCYAIASDTHLYDFTNLYGKEFEFEKGTMTYVLRFCKDFQERSQAGYVSFGSFQPGPALRSTPATANFIQVRSVKESRYEETAVMYLQVSVISQALIFVCRSRAWSFLERPGVFLVVAFAVAQLIATIIAVYANWPFAKIQGCGWGWAGITWLYNIIWYIPLDAIKIVCRYLLTGDAWGLVTEQRVAFTRQQNYGQQARQAQWVAFAKHETKGHDPFVIARQSIAARQSLTPGQGVSKPNKTTQPRRSILGLRPAVSTIYHVAQNVGHNVAHNMGHMAREITRELVHPQQRGTSATTRKGREAADKARRRAELARLRETHTLKGHLESVARLKGLEGAADNFYTFNPLFRQQQQQQQQQQEQQGEGPSSNLGDGGESSNHAGNGNGNRRYSIS